MCVCFNSKCQMTNFVLQWSKRNPRKYFNGQKIFNTHRILTMFNMINDNTSTIMILCRIERDVCFEIFEGLYKFICLNLISQKIFNIIYRIMFVLIPWISNNTIGYSIIIVSCRKFAYLPPLVATLSSFRIDWIRIKVSYRKSN